MSDLLGDLVRDSVRQAADRVTPPPVAHLHTKARRRVVGIGAAVLITAGLISAAVVALPSNSGSSRLRAPDRIAAAPDWVPVVPGASAPSPYPYVDHNQTGYPDACVSPPQVDSRGYVTAPVSVKDQDVLRPPGPTVAGATREQVLARFAASSWGQDRAGHPFAIFGLYSAAAPATIQPDGSAIPIYQDTPMWLVAVCDLPPFAGGSNGPALMSPPAPGTSPSPGAAGYGVLLAPYDATGQAVAFITTYGRPSEAQLAEQFVHVPWQRTRDDAMDGRQIGISYPAAEPCATFDHLLVNETSTTVYVQVWLRLLPGGPAQCPGDLTHSAIVGLSAPLGDRTLIDAARPVVAASPGK